MKKVLKSLAALTLAASFSSASAAEPTKVTQNGCQSTVTTGCGNTYTYNSCNVSVQSSSNNGQTTSTVIVDGKKVLTETCSSAPGGGIEFDICKIAPFLCK